MALMVRSAMAAAPVDFNRDIRPIFAGSCLKCHGIDEGSRKSKLRLDLRETATSPAKSGAAAIIPGHPEKSELIRRVFSTDPDVFMPPPAAHVTLSDAQKNLLRQWISEGAKYETHWAFVAPKQDALPPVKARDWPRNAIDFFVLAKLEENGLTPSPQADRYTLVRRLYLDLIGLPPTPQEAVAFVNDSSPDAYERLVDRLLASPHYGERWARRWLDLARYSDTNGFEKDRPRSIWPYRDWVIDALNADMPFDEFTVEQIAGDMLPSATEQQKIATGFHRNTMLNEEGGIDPLEYRFLAMIDRINTTGTVWLGLTVGCAQCHTHKYDPILHTDYYQLMAFLDNADEPQLQVPDETIAAERKQVEEKLAKLTAELPEKFPIAGKSSTTNASSAPSSKTDSDADKELASTQPSDDRSIATRRKEAFEAAFAKWEAEQSARAVKWTVLRPTQMQSSKPFLTLLKDDSILAGGDTAKSVTYDLEFEPAIRNITAVRLEVLPDPSLPDNGPGMVYYEGQRGDFFLSEISLQANGKTAKFKHAAQDFGTPAKAAIDGDPQTGWSVAGGAGQPHVAVFSLAEAADDVKDLKLHLLFERYFAAPLGHFRISVTDDPRALEPEAFPPEVEEVLKTDADNRSESQRKCLVAYFCNAAPELAEARKEIAQLRQPLPAPVTTLVMREWPAGHHRKTFLHHRGEWLSPEQEVQPGIPAFLPPLPTGQPANRLTFARWLVSRDNPLTARVQVNRQWAAFFGRGIVRTVQDFGYQGELPSNQKLLDWLAVQFMNEGWSLKKLDRLIVTSATYRQSSRLSPQLLRRDPENVILGRGPRFRLDAELIRDSALMSAGLLSEKLGGPSVFPPQPASITTEGAYGALAWNTSTGEDRYRRSLYTYSKRTAPFALYMTFDAPSGEACTAHREVSNSPLQALSVMNDAVFLEAAQAMGRMYGESSESDESRAAEIFRRFLVRPPDPDELAMLVRFASEQRGRFKTGELDAKKVQGSGDGNAVERATWTTVARAVMNLDEEVTKD